ncbi:S-adenosylmethionine carrier 2 [Actinidia rufa]|uniref:S-adenosylmethionine carrier 2 n=1 Tax=Actinidia rufa TaxID=165716 RepID=A0A7J0FDE2_9ERIC|nr:S-adenosylmethionine carrier 2 [Actinidia rufa]
MSAKSLEFTSTLSRISNLKASAIFVGVYEPTKQKLLKSFPDNLSALAHLTAGAVGGAASSIIRVPTEVVKQRMQTGQFSSAPDAVRLIVAKEGFKGLYAGYGSFLLRDLPFDAIQFCIYEQLRMGYKLAARRDLKDPENAIIGAFAVHLSQECRFSANNGLQPKYLYDKTIVSHRELDESGRGLGYILMVPASTLTTTPRIPSAITGAITTPLDVIKTRLMLQGSANQYKGIFDCVRTIVREEGTPALLKSRVFMALAEPPPTASPQPIDILDNLLPDSASLRNHTPMEPQISSSLRYYTSAKQTCDQAKMFSGVGLLWAVCKEIILSDPISSDISIAPWQRESMWLHGSESLCGWFIFFLVFRPPLMVLGLKFFELRSSPPLVRFSVISVRLLYHLLRPILLIGLLSLILGSSRPFGCYRSLGFGYSWPNHLSNDYPPDCYGFGHGDCDSGEASRCRGRGPWFYTHCDQDNHTVGRCWDLHGRLVAHQATIVPETNVVTIFADEYQRLLTA